MAWPSDLARTKNWGAEVLTDADLEGQLDLIINWAMAALDSASGHAHEGTANKSQKVSIASGLTVASQAQGDVIYASSASAFARLGAGTKGQCLTTGGAAANPSWLGMTTRGDIEYFDATSRARLAVGAVRSVLKSDGTDPGWSATPTIETITLFTVCPASATADTLYKDTIIKGWVNMNLSTPAITDDANVSGYVDDGAGLVTIQWATDFADTKYCVATMAGEASASSPDLMASEVYDNRAAGSIQLRIVSSAGALVDATTICAIATGDQ